MTTIGRSAVKYITSGCILLALAYTAVLLRFLSARKRKQNPRPRDYFLSFSLLCMTGFVISKIYAIVHGGFGLPSGQVTNEQLSLTMKVFWAGTMLSATSVVCFRLAITLLYMELFRMHRFHGLALITTFFVSLIWVASILTMTLICQPISRIWSGVEGSCGRLLAIEIFHSVLNVVVDIWVVVLPLPVIWRMQITERRKLGITASFAIGVSTAAANIGRLISTESCPSSLGFSYCDLNDSIWMTAETCGGILMAGVPTLGNLFFYRKAKPSSDPAAGRNQNLVTIGSAPIRSKKASNPQFPGSTYTRMKDLDERETPMTVSTENAAEIETLSRSSRNEGIPSERRHA